MRCQRRVAVLESGSPHPLSAVRAFTFLGLNPQEQSCSPRAGACAGRRFWGLGLAATAAFLIALASGVLLHFLFP